ncbi:DMT family transporter [candidate division KSB1 bacterium]
MKIRFVSGVWLAFLAAFLWSTGGVGIKLLSLDGLQISAFRAFFAAAALVPFFRLRDIRWNYNLIGFLISFAVMTSTFVIATKLTTAANAIALQYTSVFWVFLIHELPRLKKFPKEKIVPFVFVLLGILSYLSEPNTGTNVLGNIIALTSGLAFGLVAVFLKRISVSNGAGIVCLANLFSFIVLFSIIGFSVPSFEKPVFTISILFYLGAVQISAAYFIFNKALKTVSALTGSFVALLEPVLNPIWVYFVLRETPTFQGIIGWICLMAGVVTYLMKQGNNNPTKAV